MNAQWLQRVDHVTEMIKEQCETRKFWFLCAFSVIYWVSTCWLASRKLMWNDELFTFYISLLPSLSDIWSALSTGADQIPPFFYMITRASILLFGENHVSIRLPEVLGFWVMSLCLFQFVSKRSSALHGLVAMLFPLVTDAYYYAFEARPYGLVLGFSGAALLSWQAAAEGYYRKLSLMGLALSLAAAISSHYYAVLLFFPLVIGEITRSLSLRRLALPIWVAFGSAMLPLLLFLPLIHAARSYSAAFWAQPLWRSIPIFYYLLLAPSVLPLTGTLILPAIYLTTHPLSPGRRDQAFRFTPPYHEIAAAFGFIAMPVVAVILAKLTTGAFTGRYALPAVLGFSILVSYGVYKTLNGRSIMAVGLGLFCCVWFLAREVGYLEQINTASLDQLKSYALLQAEQERTLPIVAADLHTFMRLVHYAPPDIASRLVYLADPGASLHYLGQTTVDRGILDLRSWFHLRVEEYGPYLASQPQFLFYVDVRYVDGSIGNLNWLLSELVITNRRIELRSRQGARLLFLVGPNE